MTDYKVAAIDWLTLKKSDLLVKIRSLEGFASVQQELENRLKMLNQVNTLRAIDLPILEYLEKLVKGQK